MLKLISNSTRTVVLPVLLMAVLASTTASAKRIYSYVDENGIKHYTDRKPDTDQPVTEKLVRDVENGKMVTMRTEERDDEHVFHFFNHWHGPIEIDLKLSTSDNIRSNPPLPGRFLLPEYGEFRIVTLQAVDLRKSWQYSLRMNRAVPGDPASSVDRDHLYQVPFRRSDRFYIGQGFGGFATHTDRQSYYAIDVTMPVGTPILAARDGIVMHIEEDFYASGVNDEKLAQRANSVRILHEDGSMAIYAHLKLESVSVKPGRTVLAGELIGLSGNTGYSTGPHLHFAIQVNENTSLTSIPFRFADSKGQGYRPEPGHWLSARGMRQAR